MKQDLIIAGVGGQGLLTIANVIGGAALKLHFHVKQSEVHGMAQRGGAVVSHLRLSASRIASDLIPEGAAHLLLSTEPMEALRYLPMLQQDAWVISNRNHVENIENYPPLESILKRVAEWPRHILVDADDLARKANARRAVNLVMLGAASSLLVVSAEALRGEIESLFARKGAEVVKNNLAAFDLGRDAAVKSLPHSSPHTP